MGLWGEESCVLLSILRWEIGQPACQQVGVVLVEENLMLQKREEGIRCGVLCGQWGGLNTLREKLESGGGG